MALNSVQAFTSSCKSQSRGCSRKPLGPDSRTKHGNYGIRLKMWHKWHIRGASWLSPNRTKRRIGFWHMCDMFIHVRAHRSLSKPAVSVKWIPDGEIPTWKPKPDHILIEALGHETDLDLSPDHPTHMTIQSLPTYPDIQRLKTSEFEKEETFSIINNDFCPDFWNFNLTAGFFACWTLARKWSVSQVATHS